MWPYFHGGSSIVAQADQLLLILLEATKTKWTLSSFHPAYGPPTTAPSVPGLAVHKNLASLVVPLLDERHATVVVRQLGFLVILPASQRKQDNGASTYAAHFFLRVLYPCRERTASYGGNSRQHGDHGN